MSFYTIAMPNDASVCSSQEKVDAGIVSMSVNDVALLVHSESPHYPDSNDRGSQTQV